MKCVTEVQVFSNTVLVAIEYMTQGAELIKYVVSYFHGKQLFVQIFFLPPYPHLSWICIQVYSGVQ